MGASWILRQVMRLLSYRIRKKAKGQRVSYSFLFMRANGNHGSALAAIVSPLVFGYVIDKTGDWTLAFLVSIRLLLIGTMLAFWVKPDEELPGAALTVTLAAKEAKL